MRSRRLSMIALTIALAIALTPMGVVRAQAPRHVDPPRRGSMEFAGDLGYTRYRVAGIRPDGGRLALALTTHLTPRAAWTFDISCLGGSPVGAPEDESFTICTGSLGAQLEVGVAARARPYVRASVGQSQLDWQAALDVFDIDARAGATTLAFGSRFALGRSGRYDLRAEAAWLRTAVLGRPAAHRSIAVGVTYRIR